MELKNESTNHLQISFAAIFLHHFVKALIFYNFAHGNKNIYRPKVDWWAYALILFTILVCMIGPIITDSDSDYLLGVILSIAFCIFLCSLIATTKYAIRGNEFGVKYLYKWNWYPIDKIESITTVKSISAAAALSTNRIAIKFSYRKILKSTILLEISPKDMEQFIAELLRVNSLIKVNSAEQG